MAQGKIWFSADNQQEAKQWQEEYLGKGAASVELKPESDRSIVHVIITLDRERAKDILGYEPEEEEWLIEETHATPASPLQGHENAAKNLPVPAALEGEVLPPESALHRQARELLEDLQARYPAASG